MATSVVVVGAIGVLQAGVAISLAALIFVGPLADGAGRAAAGFLLGTAIMSIIVAVRSSMQTVIAGAQDTAAIIAAAIATSIAGAVATPDATLATVVVMLAVAAITTGVAMSIIGHFGWGSLVRVLPAPVVSGFMAGTGWLLFRGGIEVSLGRVVHLGDVGELVDWSGAIRFLLPALALGVFMLGATSIRNGGLFVSLAILFGAIGFHVVGRSLTSIDMIERDGWLIGPLPDGASWAPVGPSDLADADWGVLASHAPAILVVAAVSVIGLLLNLSGLESVLGNDIDVDHEFRLTGPSNVLVGATGGLVAYHLIGDTLLAQQLGVRSRRTTLAIGLFVFAIFAIGFDLIGLVPRSIAGGVLIGLGLGLLRSWGRALRRTVDRVDVVLNVLILLAIAVAGVLSGVVVGIVVAALVFVVRYSRIDPVRHRLHAAGRSNVDRLATEQVVLSRDPNRITALELQGYLFFGSVDRLRDRLQVELGTTDAETDRPDAWLILDCRRVTGVDATAAGALAATIDRLRSADVRTLWCGVSDSLRAGLDRGGVDTSETLPDLDHAIAAAEDELLDAERLDVSRDTLTFTLGNVSYPPSLTGLLEQQPVAAGTMIVELGTHGRELFIVESGTFTAWTSAEVGSRRRLRQIGVGSVIGEMSFVTGQPRTACVQADTDAVVLGLTFERFEQLRTDDPEAALDVQQWLLERMAGRLAATSGLVTDLMR